MYRPYVRYIFFDISINYYRNYERRKNENVGTQSKLLSKYSRKKSIIGQDLEKGKGTTKSCFGTFYVLIYLLSL